MGFLLDFGENVLEDFKWISIIELSPIATLSLSRSLVGDNKFSNWSTSLGAVLIDATKQQGTNQWTWAKNGEFLDVRWEQRFTFDKTFLLSLFETGGDPNGQCAFLDLKTFKIQEGDCNKDQTYFFCASGKRKHFLFLMKLTPFPFPFQTVKESASLTVVGPMDLNHLQQLRQLGQKRQRKLPRQRRRQKQQPSWISWLSGSTRRTLHLRTFASLLEAVLQEGNVKLLKKKQIKKEIEKKQIRKEMVKKQIEKEIEKTKTHQLMEMEATARALQGEDQTRMTKEAQPQKVRQPKGAHLLHQHHSSTSLSTLKRQKSEKPLKSKLSRSTKICLQTSI